MKALWKCGKRPLHRWKTDIHGPMEMRSCACSSCLVARLPTKRMGQSAEERLTDTHSGGHRHIREMTKALGHRGSINRQEGNAGGPTYQPMWRSPGELEQHMAVTKTHPIKSTLFAAIDYICNPDKMDGKLLGSSWLHRGDRRLEFAWTAAMPSTGHEPGSAPHPGV